jgi:hypothetical protein
MVLLLVAVLKSAPVCCRLGGTVKSADAIEKGRENRAPFETV